MLRTTIPFLLGAALCAQTPAPQTPAPQTPAPAPAAAPTPPAAMQTIRKETLLAHATWLASDELGGRLTGSPGQEMAAKYILEHFTKLGLEPLGDVVDGKRGYVQRYGIVRTAVTPASFLQFGQRKLTNGFAILGGRPAEVHVDGALRFAGLGRTRGSSADLPEDVSLQGQVPVVLIKPPRGKVDRPLSVEEKFGMSFQSFGSLGKTTKNLEKRGAQAVLFVQLADPNGLSDVLNYLALAPGKDSLAPSFPGADDQMGMVSSLLSGGDGALAIVLSVAESRAVLADLGVQPEAAAGFLTGGESPKAKSDVPVKVQVAVTRDDHATASNVVAVLRGSDPALAGEAVVYSAHMDHVGRRLDGEIYNGADDNASGSAGLLAIAEAYAKSPTKPRRSVIFLSVSGEELGLWGSAYWSDHPTWDLDKVIADVNTDMIGRSGPESGPTEVTVTPSNHHDMFSTLVRDAAGFAGALGLTFTSGDKYYMRSDHYNFAKKGVPVVFFCNGEHEDYHQVTDHADKLDGAKMERIARLAFWTGWNAANADDRPRKLGRRADWR